MRRLSSIYLLLAAVVPFLAATSGVAAAGDQKLLSLVPPGSGLVTGINPIENQPPRGIVFLSTGYSRHDYKDFFALIGADSSRRITQVLITDFPGRLGQHSVLASGSFDQARIYKSITDAGNQIVGYRGIPIVRIAPFARDHAEFTEIRWLAILDSKLVLFGAFDAVHQELDRYIERSAPDPFMLKNIARLRHGDATWSLVSAPARNTIVQDALASLDPQLGTLPTEGAFQLGIRYGNVIELEYEVTTSAQVAYSSPHSLTPSMDSLNMASSVAPEGSIGVAERRIRGLIKIPANRYSAWFDDVSAQRRAQNEAAH